jgi:acyl-CoA thioester hydrolase
MSDLKYTDTVITARYQETDMMGIIHHSVYPVWFEAARTDLIKSFGYSYSSLEKMGLMLPLIKLEVEYLLPSYYEDEIIIKSSIKELTKTRLTVSYELYRIGDEKTILNRGTTIHVFTDRELRPVNIQKKFPEVYGSLVRYNE